MCFSVKRLQAYFSVASLLSSNPVVSAGPSLASTELRGAGTVVAAVRPGLDRVAQQVLGFLACPLLFPSR